MSNEKVLELHSRNKDENVKALRREMKVPGVIYGGTIDGGQPIWIDELLLNDILKKNTKSTVIPASLDGDGGNVIVKEVVRNNITSRVEHIDLQAIRKNEVLTFDIPVIFTGEENITHRKLLLNTVMNTLSVKGPANKVPYSLEMEIGDMELDEKLFAKDIKLPEGVELMTDPEELMLSVTQSKMEQDLETIEEEAVAAAEETEAAETPAEKTEENAEEKTEEKTEE